MSRVIQMTPAKPVETECYPFTSSEGLSLDGIDVQLLVLDAKVVLYDGGALCQLTDLVIGGTSLDITMATDAGFTLTGSWTSGSALNLVDDIGRAAGLLVIDPEYAASVLGSTTPSLATSLTLAASATVPLPVHGVTAFKLPDGSLVAGDVWLVGEHGASVTASGRNVTIAFPGDPGARGRTCGAQAVSTFIKTINGFEPDKGEFSIISGDGSALDSILRVTPVVGGVKIHMIGIAAARGLAADYGGLRGV